MPAVKPVRTCKVWPSGLVEVEYWNGTKEVLQPTEDLSVLVVDRPEPDPSYQLDFGQWPPPKPYRVSCIQFDCKERCCWLYATLEEVMDKVRETCPHNRPIYRVDYASDKGWVSVELIQGNTAALEEKEEEGKE